MNKTNLDKILNEALNKALIGRNKIKQVNSNEIADFVNKHLAAINYTHSCKSDSEQLCANCQCKPTQKLGFCNECFDDIYSSA
tara:strand:+ start:39 stop:287 length:249 start_codon:yes stop_codon:yes gene_type:complete